MAEVHNPGENKAWELLASLQPDFVCRAGDVVYDDGRDAYIIKSFGKDFIISVKDRSISSASEGSDALLQRLSYFFRLSVLWYLASVKDISCTGRLVKLEQIRGGDAFTRGSHVLPLEAIADKYGKNKEGFIQKGNLLGASQTVNLGDVSIQLLPLPRVPVILSLWLAEEEFPARVNLLFDSTCELQLPADIIWSIAMMTTLIML
jgi:hypothetical protein